MARGNRKLPIFEDDHDRRLLLKTMHRMAERYSVRCLAYCLMTNHYHLVAETPRGNLSMAMRYLNGVYTQASNRRHRRTGHVFEGRFRSIVVDSEAYLRDVARYVVLNPVRARLVHDASAWAWSSYRATAGLEPGPAGLCLEWLEEAFGGPVAEAQLKYRLFVNDVLTKFSVLNDDALFLGPKAFEVALGQRYGVVPGGPPRSRAVRALARPTLVEIFAAAPMSLPDRNQLIREAHERFGYRLSEIAVHLGLHPSTASLALRRLEAVEAQARSRLVT
jgi:REP element-mobilizing transposase RayT